MTADEMREVDRVAVEVHGIHLLQMMELAGGHLAWLALDRFGADGPVHVLAGPGGNGGGALVAARRLHGRGVDVRVRLSTEAGRLGAVPARHLRTLISLGVPVHENGVPEPGGLALDGMVGYGLRSALEGRAAELAGWCVEAGVPVLALDVPSGLDATTGRAPGAVVRADATLTLALPKTGLLEPKAAPLVGELYLGDIGIPPAVYAALGIEVGPIFAEGDVVRLV